MGTRDARNSMPNDPARICRLHGRGAVECKVLDTLGVKMDFAMLVARETLKKFGESALRAMAPVNKGRDDGQPQVRSSRDCGSAGATPASLRTLRKTPASANGTKCQGAGTNMPLAPNPDTAPFRQTSFESAE